MSLDFRYRQLSDMDLEFGHLSKRVVRVAVMRSLGMSYRKIGEHFGVTKERVRQIFLRGQSRRRAWSKMTPPQVARVSDPEGRELVTALDAIIEAAEVQYLIGPRGGSE